MSIENPLSKLIIDKWYKALMAVGSVCFLLTGAGLLPKFPTEPTAFIAAGVFFIGLGEWVNHPLKVKIYPATFNTAAGTVRSNPRAPKRIGVFFDLIGVILIGAGATLSFTS